MDLMLIGIVAVAVLVALVGIAAVGAMLAGGKKKDGMDGKGQQGAQTDLEAGNSGKQSPRPAPPIKK